MLTLLFRLLICLVIVMIIRYRCPNLLVKYKCATKINISFTKISTVNMI